MISAKDLWNQVLSDLETQLSPVTVTTWFDDAEALSIFNNQLIIYTPVDIKKQIIETKYKSLVLESIGRYLETDSPEMIILCSEEERINFLKTLNSKKQISEQYTFSSFVIGNSNRFAQAAAMAVATKPVTAYNPLFIYGPSGLGKTHLLYAIANEIKKTRPENTIVYIKGDEFTNELINAIQHGRVEPFRQKYRNADLFLVDDIQFIAGKERTQEEFFHTFNTLHEANRQIVLTSDRPPREMHTLEDRLKTRFEWGLLADIEPPDYETRIAIISKKAEQIGIFLPGDVLDYIACAITNNVRQLEGAVKKIFALKELMNQDVTIRLAEQAIKDIMRENPGLRPTPSMILNEVASVYNVSPIKLTGNNRSKELVVPRQIAMFLIRSMTDLSLPEIGKEFNRDHTTVLYSINRVEDQLKNDLDLSNQIKDLTKNIENK